MIVSNEKGHLTFAGMDCMDIVKKYGTPVYAMDKNRIIKMCNVFKNALDTEYGDGLVLYASKAFSCKEIYRIINSVGLGCDVVSGGELFTAKSVNFPSNKICFHGNNKSEKELVEAIQYGVKYIVLDSVEEAEIINNICINLSKKQDVLIRVNPGVEAHTHHFIQTSKVDSKFGFLISDGSAEEMITQVLKFENINLVGLHCHIGSQIFEDKSFKLAIDKMTDFYQYLSSKYAIEFTVLNLGGGFGVYYSGDDRNIEPEEYYNCIKNITDNLKACIKDKKIKKPFLILEPGRSIVGEAGITLYTVGNVKEIKGVKNYISIDGGMFENPRFALYQAKYSVLPANKMNDAKIKTYSIAGKCCESGDIIAEECLLPKINKGDILAVLTTGAYNYSMSSNYNRNLVPPVVFIDNGESYFAVKPQTYEDLIRNDV